MDAEREWWHRTVDVLRHPRPVFRALRADSRDDADARQEPLLAVVWLAGIAWVLADPVAGRVFDDPAYDWVLVLVWAFIAGGIVGVGGYWVLGGALALGLRGLGSTGTYRRARHILGFAAVPFTLSLVVVVARVAAFGGDTFRSGGSDDGAAGTTLVVAQLAFAAWTVGLLVVGVMTVEEWSVQRAAGSLGLLVLFTAAFWVLAQGLL